MEAPLLFTGVYNSRSVILKISLFATGCAGIVAEFVLSTLATYLLGNAVFQWTVVMSLMLFAMGIGSRLSRLVEKNLLNAFIITEFLLSILCAVSAQIAYVLASFTSNISFVIYFQAFLIGSLIGLEIPLATRINQEYEELRLNISGVMEKDYFGALFGGLFFAFFALPYLGLTYTPVALGSVNFIVACLLLFCFFSIVKKRWPMIFVAFFTGLFLFITGWYAEPVIRYGEQAKYKDKVIFSKQTAFQKIVITRWKNFYWLYINGQEQFSTFDEEKYHEPLVHPAMNLAVNVKNVLILGGGDGLALREVLKYPNVKSVKLVDLDPEMTKLAANHPVLSSINQNAMSDSKVEIINKDAAKFFETDALLYDVIIIDLPDPDSIDLMHVYSERFYNMVRTHLARGGLFVTQATSPYFSKDAFLCILKTIQQAGFSTVPYHNQIPTMGEWGWIIGAKKKDAMGIKLRQKLLEKKFDHISVRFLNRDAMISMAYFGKGIFDEEYMKNIKINTELSPVLYRYYLAGSWGMY